MAGPGPEREDRLRAGWQFREVYRSGRAFHGELMTLVTLDRPEERARVAFVAGRRVGSAVRRNRAKRLLREAFRGLPDRDRTRRVWRVWIARGPCAAAPLKGVSTEMKRLLSREVRA